MMNLNNYVCIKCKLKANKDGSNERPRSKRNPSLNLLSRKMKGKSKSNTRHGRISLIELKLNMN